MKKLRELSKHELDCFLAHLGGSVSMAMELSAQQAGVEEPPYALVLAADGVGARFLVSDQTPADVLAVARAMREVTDRLPREPMKEG